RSLLGPPTRRVRSTEVTPLWQQLLQEIHSVPPTIVNLESARDAFTTAWRSARRLLPVDRMKAAKRFGAVGMAIAFLVLVTAQGGCSSASSAPSPTPCATTPTPPVQDDFCTATASYLGRCGHCDDCTEKNLQNCAKRGSANSAAYRA